MDLHLFQTRLFLGWDVMGLAGEKAAAGEKKTIAGAAGAGAGARAEAGVGAGVGAGAGA